VTSTTTALGDPATTQQLDRELGERLLALMESFKDYFFSALSEIDLTPPQAFALRQLHEPCPMRDLADAMGYDASHITGIVDRLERRGLVERRTDPTDRRVKLLVVTDAGRALQAEIEARVFDQLPVLERLSVAQRHDLRDLLDIMTAGDHRRSADGPC
jgi:DNA-binding MarR family transcriptional regulator